MCINVIAFSLQITREEDQVTWSVDHQVSVAGGNTGEARLKVKECRWTADFNLPCKVRPRTDDKKIPVFVRRKKTNDLIQVIDVTCTDVVDECGGDHIKLDEDDQGMMTCEIRGVCHVVCAVEQEVWLKEATMSSPQAAIEAAPPGGTSVVGLASS